MFIKWLGQSGYLIYDEKNTICIDPYLSDAVGKREGRERMVKAFIEPKDLKCDVLICTHNHLDHLDIDAIPYMKKENITFLAPKDAKKALDECGVINYKKFDIKDTYSIGDFKLTAVYANHTVPAIGVLLEHKGIKLYFSGDTYFDEKLYDIKDYNVDMSFICINGKLGNMNVEEAVKLTKIINPKVAVPNHYGMFSSNTEDPLKYTKKLNNAVELMYAKEYNVSEVIKNV